MCLRRLFLGCAIVSFLLAIDIETWSQTLEGRGRFERIAGNPEMGYQQLYEWDLYVSRDTRNYGSTDDVWMVGPSRRLGAPPGEGPRGDGFYRVEGLPPGDYSIYVNQPDFFASPKVINDVVLRQGEDVVLDVELDVDYSTYFSESGEWTEWKSTWYQTFVARGTSVRGVSWKMAGAGLYKDQKAEIAILEDNSESDVRDWALVAQASDSQLSADSDEWVRWESGQAPLTSGKRYAVRIQIPGGMGIYKRDKDEESFQHGSAYDENGEPQEFDLNMTVFVDRDSLVTHTRRTSGPGEFDGSLSAIRWGQTFVATGDALLAVDLFAASGLDDFDVTWAVRQGGPTGQRIGQIKCTQGAYFASGTRLLGVSWNEGEISLTQGETYYIDLWDSEGFTPYTQPAWNRYEDGQAYRNGEPIDQDLSMTIIQSPVTAAR